MDDNNSPKNERTKYIKSSNIERFAKRPKLSHDGFKLTPVISSFENNETTLFYKSKIEEIDVYEPEIVDPIKSQSTSENTEIMESKLFTWSHSQTELLLKALIPHAKILDNSKGKAVVIKKITAELNAKGVPANEAQVKNKWKNLIRTYRSCYTMKQKPGGKAFRFLYFDTMKKHFGTLETVSPIFPNTPLSRITNTSVMDIDSRVKKENVKKIITDALLSPTETKSFNENSNSETEDNITPDTVDFDIDRQFLSKEYMLLLEKEFAKRQKRHEERIAIDREKMKIERDKIAIEKVKLKLLDEYLDKC